MGARNSLISSQFAVNAFKIGLISGFFSIGLTVSTFFVLKYLLVDYLVFLKFINIKFSKNIILVVFLLPFILS